MFYRDSGVKKVLDVMKVDFYRIRSGQLIDGKIRLVPNNADALASVK